jgi:hypothetical protein
MTVQHLLVFGVTDIRAFRVECTKCGTAVTYERDQRFRILPSCPSCQEQFDTRQRPRLVETLESLVHQLQSVDDDGPVRLRFQIDRAASPDDRKIAPGETAEIP